MPLECLSEWKREDGLHIERILKLGLKTIQANKGFKNPYFLISTFSRIRLIIGIKGLGVKRPCSHPSIVRLDTPRISARFLVVQFFWDRIFLIKPGKFSGVIFSIILPRVSCTEFLKPFCNIIFFVKHTHPGSRLRTPIPFLFWEALTTALSLPKNRKALRTGHIRARIPWKE